VADLPSREEIHELTYAVDSISIKSIIACAVETTNHIDTGGIHMAVVHIQFTFINVYVYRVEISHMHAIHKIVDSYNN